MRKFILTLVAVGLAGCAPILTEVTSVSPEAGAVIVLNSLENFEIVVEFDHKMDIGSVTADSFIVTGTASGVIDPALEAGYTLTNGGFKVVFTTLAPLFQDETVTVQLTASIRSQSGKNLDPFSWSFEVESNLPDPPTSDFLVASMNPSIESVTAAAATLLQPTFTNPYDPFAAAAATVMVEGSRSGARQVTLQNVLIGIDTLTIASDRPFLAGERVSVALLDGLFGFNGIQLDPILLGVTVLNLGSDEWPGTTIDSGTSLGAGTIVFLDLDADGVDEWAIVGGDGIVELQDSSPSGPGNSTSWTLPEPLAGAAVGDFDGDGRVDLVCLGATAERIYLLRGSFSIAIPLEDPVLINLATPSTRINAAHVDTDGITDLLTSGSGGLSVLWGSSSDPFNQQTLVDTGAVLGTAVATDLDGDDIIDLAAVQQSDGSILILTGDDRGGFDAAGTVTGYTPAIDIVVGNLDGDALRDLLVIPALNDTPSVLLPDGELNFSLRILFDGAATQGAKLVDWNGDGMLDSLTPDPDGTGLHLSLGLGDGNFEMPVDLDHAEQIRSLSLGDANGDGALDIALEQTGGNWEIQQVESANSPPPPPLPPGNRVHVDDISADAGDSAVPCSIYVDTLSDLAGWTLVLQYDPQAMQISAINTGPAVASFPPPAFHEVNIDNVNGVASVGVLLDFFLTVVLPNGLNHEVEQALVDIPNNALSGVYTFGPANGQAPSSSPLQDTNSLADNFGNSISPELITGTLTIGGGALPGSDPNGGGDSDENETSGNEDPPVEEVTFLRGDVNGDGSLDVTDGSNLQLWLTGGGTMPPCLDAADVNDDGMVNLSDPIDLFEFLYQGSNPPPAPYPSVGIDPTADGLDCDG